MQKQILLTDEELEILIGLHRNDKGFRYMEISDIKTLLKESLSKGYSELAGLMRIGILPEELTIKMSIAFNINNRIKSNRPVDFSQYLLSKAHILNVRLLPYHQLYGLCKNRVLRLQNTRSGIRT